MAVRIAWRVLALALAWVMCGTAVGAQYTVSPTGKADGAGTARSPWSLKKANEALSPGDTAVLLDGRYTVVPIAPARSGQAGKAITYRAANRHKALFTETGATAKFHSGGAAVFISGRSHITLDGIKVVGAKRWIMAAGCSHITVTNCHFQGGSGWINCRFDDSGERIRLVDNHFNEGTDLVSIDGGSGHLVEGNTFGDATHTGLVLLGVQRSVVRNNRLSNRRWRCMEVESRRRKPYRLSMYNLVEGNVFDYTPCSAIQWAGNRSILRRNVFRRCLTGMNWANYVGSNKGSKKRSPEAWHDESNRFYNNVLAECGTNATVLALIARAKAQGVDVAERVSQTGCAMTFATNMFNPKLPGYDDCAYGDNVVVNNAFYRNGNTTGGADKKGPTAGTTTQVAFDWNATPRFARFYSNAFFSGPGPAEAFYFCDAAYLKPPEPRRRSVAGFQKRYPLWAKGNVDVDPQFRDGDKGDFHLKAASPCIDAGRALTAARAAGRGKRLQVVDALFFTDGCGLVAPDVIRVGAQRVKIVSIDYDTHTISLAADITWSAAAPVSLDYAGKAPDIGAFEFE